MNVNKIVVSIVVGVVILGGFIWIARPNGKSTLPVSANTNGALMVQDASNYDFGSISMANGKVNHEFKIKNIGVEAVTISKVYTSCMCTTAVLIIGDPSVGSGQVKKLGPYGMPGHVFIPTIGETLNPNEEATVDVVFDPAAHGPAGVGKIERAVIVENNAGQPIELLFSAMVTP